MKEFVEKYRPLRQRTVWEETTMDKARASPPAIYMKQLLAGLANGFNSGDQPVRAHSDKGTVQATSESGNVTDVTFVDDCIAEVAVTEVRTDADEYDADSENDFSDRKRMKILPQLQFLDLGGQFSPSFVWISKVP